LQDRFAGWLAVTLLGLFFMKGSSVVARVIRASQVHCLNPVPLV
jgi:hypothetical protein